jgi:flavin reductase (DIM6/NTAB) family NADH-FMN oxidoreductase RutF
MTVSAFSSLSLNPPLVLVCVDKKSESHAAFQESGAFVVNILADDQEAVSRRFATKAADKFEGVAYHKGIEDAPVLGGALANLECRIVQAYEGGDHTIFVGEVERNSTRDAQPLLYFRGGYAELNRER